MQIKSSFRTLFKALFHKRNIIIMSERSTSHLSMSGKIQFAIILVVISMIVGASFSTGKYMAARQVISDQDNTIKSVANSRIETNYNFGVPNLSNADDLEVTTPKNFSAPLTDPSYAFSTLDESKLVARIAFLEHRNRELARTNSEIITVVRKTADGQIKGLEEVIRQTGLSPDTLKKHASQEKKIRRKPVSLADGEDGQGGPYIPAHWDNQMISFVDDLDNKTDELYVLRLIMETLPTMNPMKKARHTSSFGHRRDPFTGRLAFHSGMDFASSRNPQVYAASDGKVSIASRRGAYGNMVEVKHGLGLSSRYAHLKRILVKPGELVKKGQLIGLQGSTGRSTGAHLHYEVRFNNRPLNPRGFLAAGEAYVSQTN